MNHILFAPSLLPCWRTSPAVGSEMAAIFPSFVPNRISTCPSLSSPATPRVALLRNSLLATPISLAPSRFFSRSNFRSSATAATVVFMLPTAKPELASTGKKPSCNRGGNVRRRWSLRSIKSFAMAELEARKLKYPSTGTEALLMVDRLDCMGALWILRRNYKAFEKVTCSVYQLGGEWSSRLNVMYCNSWSYSLLQISLRGALKLKKDLLGFKHSIYVNKDGWLEHILALPF
ncbi:hypothetical protein ZIOFF_024137 [Zingiber officinale]|uniref:Uncharacterized protein n=1 Tax=Zingiber officinale TaxID=94328 RepID=A0A8J5HBJ9_ZINOF|nr:hypothetical protein ZIOFF_024137 [Zingiber officinale]